MKVNRPGPQLMLPTLAFGITAGVWGFCLPSQALAADEETPKEIIASQIRKQGFRCESPQSAERDAVLSKPHEAVWVLRCENATYRVRLIPDKAAQVERLK